MKKLAYINAISFLILMLIFGATYFQINYMPEYEHALIISTVNIWNVSKGTWLGKTFFGYSNAPEVTFKELLKHYTIETAVKRLEKCEHINETRAFKVFFKKDVNISKVEDINISDEKVGMKLVQKDGNMYLFEVSGDDCFLKPQFIGAYLQERYDTYVAIKLEKRSLFYPLFNMP